MESFIALRTESTKLNCF